MPVGDWVKRRQIVCVFLWKVFPAPPEILIARIQDYRKNEQDKEPIWKSALLDYGDVWGEVRAVSEPPAGDDTILRDTQKKDARLQEK